MNTPICDFVNRYAGEQVLRLHMPGHKGKTVLGCEERDITEVEGADVLYASEGIIRESEENAAALFGTARTVYSTEGSSLAIRGMLYLAMLSAKAEGKRPLIAAGRNAHKTFMTAAALLDFEIDWLYPQQGTLLSCELDAGTVESYLQTAFELPAAVYVTSPDYLGNVVDIRAVAEVCHRFGVMLLVDNAHGAYLHFLPESCHPIALGADACCDSAHKTLPVLTGGAYLHISASAPSVFSEAAEDALALFASTSPSYLILQSLDAANAYLADGYRERLLHFAELTDTLKGELKNAGFMLCGNEPLKLTIAAKACGYTGTELAALLRQYSVSAEFADPDYLVLMVTPETGEEGLLKLKEALLAIRQRAPIFTSAPVIPHPARVLTPREALLSPGEVLPLNDCLGRVSASAAITCPPAVPIAVCGEVIDEEVLHCLAYYGITTCRVVK